MMHALILALAAAGCGAPDDELPRQAVSGRITLDGKPLERGMISFAPLGGGGASPVSVGAVIREGSYSIARAGGPVPGSYRVAIISEGGAPEAADAAPGPGELKSARKEPIPARYNAATTLKADVVKGGSNTFDYELTSQ
jgi:hypothetical protein